MHYMRGYIHCLCVARVRRDTPMAVPNPAQKERANDGGTPEPAAKGQGTALRSAKKDCGGKSAAILLHFIIISSFGPPSAINNPPGTAIIGAPIAGIQ